MVSNSGLSDMDSMSDCVTDDCDDKESDDAAGDDMAIINGVTLSAQECAVKHPLKQGWDFHTCVKVGFLSRLASNVGLKCLRLYAHGIPQCTQFVYAQAPAGIDSDSEGCVKAGILFSSPRWNSP